MMASTRPSEPPPEETVAPTAAPAAGPDGLKRSGFVVGIDWVLAGVVLTLAFFAGSFSVRNSDFWMHLATGRLIAAGEYSFGTDPFSYATAGRTWVNHEWLYDFGLYQLFKAGEGSAVVIAKCLTLVLAAGLLMLARRPGQSAFPFIVGAGLAVVAAAPRLALQPQIPSILLLAGLMCALVRVPKRAGSWTFPAVIAGLFAVWANVDQWFFIGPALLALYAAGQFVRRDPDTDLAPVLIALGVGVAACMINPHHVRIWEVPGELAGGRLEQVFAADPEFGPLFRGGLDKSAWDFDANPANPAAQLALILLSVAGFALNYRHLSVGLALVWVGATALAGWHLRAMPFFAFVAAPVAAVNLAQAAARFAARPLPEGTVRALATAQTTGRFAVGLVGLLLIAVSYAGWLHPFQTQRRWKWDVDPVASNRRAAEQIHQWRTTGALPPEARVLNLQPDLANYIAWHAPGQKTFFDYRLGLMAPDAEDYAGVRRRLWRRSDAEAKQDPFDFTAFLRQHEVVYAVTAHPNRARNQYALAVLWQAGPASDWDLWQVTGRAVILGWQRQTAVPKAAVAGLRFDPARTAFVDPRPVGEPTDLHPPFRPLDVWDRYVAAPPASPADGEEVLVLDQYRESRMGRLVARHQFLLGAPRYFLLRLLSPALQEYVRYMGLFLPVEYPAEVNAASLLAVRSGRRAVLASPDHPDGYYFLARAYQDPGYLTVPDARTIVTTANFARMLARLPADPAQRGGVTVEVQDACQRLFAAHMEALPPRKDLALECRRVATAFMRQNYADLDAEAARATDDAERKMLEREVTAGKQIVEQMMKATEQAQNDLRSADNTFVNSVANVTSPVERAAVARRLGLANTAIAELEKAHQAFVAQLADETSRGKMTPTDQALYVAVHAELIELLLFAGRAEEAAALLDALDTDDNLEVMNRETVRRQYAEIREKVFRRMFPGQPSPRTRYNLDPAAQVRSLRQVVALAVGQYEGVGGDGGVIRAQEADAKQIRADLDGHVRRFYPAGAPKLTAVADVDFGLDLHHLSLLGLALPRVPVSPGVAALAQSAILFRMVSVAMLQEYANLVGGRIDAHARLALTYLEMGKMDEAVHHFKEAAGGPELPTPTPSRRIAQTYLKAIAQARGAEK